MKTVLSPEHHGLPREVWLASRSPRRLELLQTLGLEVKIFLAQPPQDAEALEAPHAQEDPLAYVQRASNLKLKTALDAMCEQALSGLVITADTTVAVRNCIQGKPQNTAHAFEMLQSLSNTVHQVHTAVSAAWLTKTGQVLTMAQAVQTSEVEFTHIPCTFIEAYIASGEPFDKAGGYGIQGIAGQYIRHISGSHSGIMGLPLCETSELIRDIYATATL